MKLFFRLAAFFAIGVALSALSVKALLCVVVLCLLLKTDEMAWLRR